MKKELSFVCFLFFLILSHKNYNFISHHRNNKIWKREIEMYNQTFTIWVLDFGIFCKNCDRRSFYDHSQKGEPRSLTIMIADLEEKWATITHDRWMIGNDRRSRSDHGISDTIYTEVRQSRYDTPRLLKNAYFKNMYYLKWAILILILM